MDWWMNGWVDECMDGEWMDGWIQWNTIHMYSSLKATQMMVKPAERSVNETSNEMITDV
jgi:hypothetical protein